MRIVVILALAVCAAPTWAQPDGGAQMFPDQPAVARPKPRPAEVDLQIKQDLQALAATLNFNNDGFVQNSAVYGARPGFFGASEWTRGFAALLNGNLVRIDGVKVLERQGNDVRAAVVYSFQPSPRDRDGERKLPDDPHQEILQFKQAPALYEPNRLVWQIVPPDVAPSELKTSDDLTEKDDLWANVAYHLAQKQPLQQTGTFAELSQGNLKQLGLGVLQFVQDYDEVFAFAPPYLIEAISPYVRSTTIFRVPNTNEIYTFNANLSGLKQADIDEVYQTVLFYEGQNETPIFRYDGRAAIGFADGHVALVSPEEADKLIWKP